MKLKHTAIRIASILLATILAVGSTAICAGAAETSEPIEPDVRVNGFLVEFPDKKPYVDENKRTMIPVRFVAESLGCNVYWDSTEYGAVCEKEGIKLILPIGSKEMRVVKDGIVSTVEMDTAAVLDSGRTLVPIRFVAEALGAWVGYSPYYSTVHIYNDVLTPEEITALRGIANKNLDTPTGDMTTVASGGARIDNLHEYMMQNYFPTVDCTIVNWFNGQRVDTKTGNAEVLSNMVDDIIGSTMSQQYTDDTLCGVTATYRTDVSCTFASPLGGGTNMYRNFGYLTVTLDEDADVAQYKQRHNCAEFGNIQPGKTYTYILETYFWNEIGTFRTAINAYIRCHNANGTTSVWSS